jgi:uncharacterized small protein (DUF1192 family)
VSETRRLTPDDLARFRADYHQCVATIVPILDEVDALTRERDEARSAWAELLAASVKRDDRVGALRAEIVRIAAQAELLSKRAEKGSEALTAEVARLRALLLSVCRQHPDVTVTDGDTSCTLAHLARRLECGGG